jgi:hypothetical protein
MDRRERSEFLERLVVLRRAYADRSDEDAKPVMALAAAMAHATTLLGALAVTRPAPAAG